MRRNACLLLFALSLLLWGISCKQRQPSGLFNPVADPKILVSRFDIFWQYWSDEVFLLDDFSGQDTAGKPMPTEQFLEALTTGSYIPLRYVTQKPDDTTRLYRLYQFDKTRHKDISETIRQYSIPYLRYYKMLGTDLPDFNFTDVQGRNYNRATCAGKIVVLNCWFIHCLACVEEMPSLNRLVESYRNRQDVVFLGLATDDKDDLQDFQKKKTFDYQLIPDKEDYMNDTLRIFAYPTQIIVDKAGKIYKILDTEAELKRALARLLRQ